MDDFPWDYVPAIFPSHTVRTTHNGFCGACPRSTANGDISRTLLRPIPPHQSLLPCFSEMLYLSSRLLHIGKASLGCVATAAAGRSCHPPARHTGTVFHVEHSHQQHNSTGWLVTSLGDPPTLRAVLVAGGTPRPRPREHQKEHVVRIVLTVSVRS